MCLKINRSVKRRDTGLVNWELLAPGYGLLVADIPPRKTSPEARSEEKQMLSQARKNSAWVKKKIRGAKQAAIVWEGKRVEEPGDMPLMRRSALQQ